MAHAPTDQTTGKTPHGADRPSGIKTQLVNKAHVADIAQVLAYRIRSLITCIEAYGDLLGDTLAQPEQRDLLFRIFESTARIEHILSDLLLFSRPMQAAFTEVTVATVIENLRVTFGDEFDERFELVRKCDAGMSLRCDERLLRQALLALIKNAVEASAEDSPVLLRVEPGSSSGTMCFVVENTGRLTPPATEENVFEPFVSTKPQSLGLGLPIARQVAAAHGGSISLHAGNPEGSVRGTLEIPLRQSGRRGAATDPDEPEAKNGSDSADEPRPRDG